MKWFSKPAPVVFELPTTPEDLLLDAVLDLRAAEREFTEAHFNVNQFYVRHREYLPVVNVAGETVLRIKPPSAELAQLISRENHAAADRANAMARWSDLKEKVDSRQSRHIGGVLVP